MGRIIGGLIISAIGFLIIWKTNWIIENFGHSSWAEAKLGSSGGTRLLYKFIGLLILFFGLLMITNLHQSFLMGTLEKLFNR